MWNNFKNLIKNTLGFNIPDKEVIQVKTEPEIKELPKPQNNQEKQKKSSNNRKKKSNKDDNTKSVIKRLKK